MDDRNVEWGVVVFMDFPAIQEYAFRPDIQEQMTPSGGVARPEISLGETE